MPWITGSEGDHPYTGSAGSDGCCHAVDPDDGHTACGTIIRSLRLWIEVPFSRARMAGGELCPTCVAITEQETAAV